MADHGKVEYATAEGNDLPAHEESYQDFLSMVKWGLGFVIALLILMGIFLT